MRGRWPSWPTIQTGSTSSRGPPALWPGCREAYHAAFAIEQAGNLNLALLPAAFVR